MDDVMFYVNVGGQTIGPANEQQVIDAIRAGKIPGEADICRVGESEWRYVREVEPFSREFGAVVPAPPPPPRASLPAAAGSSTPGAAAPAKRPSWVIAVVIAVPLLASCLGCIVLATMMGGGQGAVASTADDEPTPSVAAPRRSVGELIVGAWVRPGLAPEVYAADGTLRIGTDPPATY